jgi:orotidine-5'-phosphate decarboxylase
MTWSLEQAREKLILALDFPSASLCIEFLDRLHGDVGDELRLRWVKVGLQLFLAEGPAFVARLQGDGYQVFLDLKLHDIPNTVAGAVRAVLPLAPALLTVHASGGPAMLAAAAEAAAGASTQLLAVTVLTSVDAEQLRAVGVDGSPAAQVERLAQLTEASGIDGLVCSPQEAARLRTLLPKAHLVTPGIRTGGVENRPGQAHSDDQQRTGSAGGALRAGASQLVIGRPIAAAADPARAYLTFLAEIAGAQT